jgi:hypothetical protein
LDDITEVVVSAGRRQVIYVTCRLQRRIHGSHPVSKIASKQASSSHQLRRYILSIMISTWGDQSPVHMHVLASDRTFDSVDKTEG